ncbi:transmembrane amino acid transporter protein-domain-containing protein [Schizophyllum amplum]|uniref:Transmembrane amino acid transporter protein-domain-containing protein n=1 Tax=Schizophyllum amplum TaxID=97359 RepID=A0A550CPT9_9AGAR|nr:transmembrane amino acid transporter protein-domain-containing protein [Auriculariopsis ampla]
MKYDEERPQENESVKGVDSFSESSEVIGAQIAQESKHSIQYRTCSWQKTAALLFSEYICLAILSFPWSFSILGIVPGILVTLGVAGTALYTSLNLWKYCLAHPEVRDIVDIGQRLFGGSQLAYNVTSLFFLLNNTFIQALHVLVGAKLLNTLSNSAACTIVFAVVSACICFFISLPRTLSQLSGMAVFAAVTMGIAVLLAIIFAGIQEHPFGYTAELGDPNATLFPIKGTTFVQAGMSAFLNITYTFVGQATIPSFIAEMKQPKDFWKAVWAVTIAEMIVFTLCGALVYDWVGNQYITSPVVGSLTDTYKKVAFSFAIPTIYFLGALYSSVSARFIFFRVFRNSEHRHSNTLIGWASWVGIVAVSWIIAFLIAEVIPFFSDMLSLMCSLFDGWFGFIFWAMAYLTLHPGAKKWDGPLKTFETLVNYALIVLGVYIIGAGTYTSVQSIIDSYHASLVGSVFTCVSNAV